MSIIQIQFEYIRVKYSRLGRKGDYRQYAMPRNTDIVFYVTQILLLIPDIYFVEIRDFHLGCMFASSKLERM